MCGICGIINLQGEPVRADQLAAMLGCLHHRGPDVQDTALPLPWIGLGHARLRVIDLSPEANQPMTSPDRLTWIVYNGEIYNYTALREELKGYGRRFRTQSDTEVALQAYEQWGETAVEKFDGMFALAVIDLARRQLLLARDRTGKKPLFYLHEVERLVFGSEIKALLAHPRVPCEFHTPVLSRYLAYGYVPGHETFYRGIHQVAPGEQITMDLPSGRVRRRRYWALNRANTRWGGSRQEAVAEIRQRVIAAVQKRLVADVPLGAFLSGGIDSTIVVGLMSRLSPQPVHTFSIGFRGDARYDETAYARIAARHFKTRHTEFIVEPKAFELIERLVYHHDQPFGDASAIPTYLLCALTKAHVTVALNGDGGDECFAGYRRFQAAVASAHVPRWASQAAAGALHQLPPRLQRTRAVSTFARFCAGAARPWDERLARWVSYFPEPNRLLRPEIRADIPDDDWLAPARDSLAAAEDTSPLTQAMSFNFHEYLPYDLHVKMDRCSMAHGLETRSPFLDTGVVELAFQLPDAWKLTTWNTKIILREAFADLLPAPIQRRGKQGFGVPLGTWFRGELREAVQDLLLAPGALISRYLIPEEIRACYETHMRGEQDLGLQLWNLLTLEVWLRMCARHVWAKASGLQGFQLETLGQHER